MDEWTSKTVELIYQTVDQPELWQDVMQRVVEHFRLNSGSIIVENRLTHATLSRTNWQLPTGFSSEYETYWKDKDFLRSFLFAQKERVFHCDAMFGKRVQYLNSEIYNDCHKKIGIHQIAGAWRPIDDKYLARFAFHKSKKQSDFTPETLGALSQVLPHCWRAIHLANTLDALQTTQTLNNETANAGAIHFVLIDFAAQIIEASNSFWPLCETPQSPFYVKKNTLHLKQKNAQDIISNAINEIRISVRNSVEQASTITIGQSLTESHFQLKLIPLQNSISILGSSYEKTEHILITIKPKFILNARNRIKIKATLSLTDAELNVCIALAKGYSVKEYSALNNKSEQTVRTHLKNIYRKLSVNSQSELVSIFLCSAL